MKNKMKKLTVFALILALSLFGMTACGQDEDVLAIVGGETEITKTDVDELTQLMIYSYGQDPADMDEDTMDQFMYSALNVYVQNEALKLHFKGQEVLPEDIDDTFQSWYESIISQEGAQEDIEKRGITEKSFRFYYESSYYSNAYAEELKEANPISEEDMKAYYDENKESFKTEDQVRASHILIGDENLTDADRAEAEAIREQVAAAPDTFAEVAKEKSTDAASAENGGDVDFFPRSGVMVEEFAAAAFELEVGEISEVVETQYGFHIIMLTDTKEAGYQTFEEAQSSIEDTLVGDLYNEHIVKLVDETGVEYFGDAKTLEEEFGAEAEEANGSADDGSTDDAANEDASDSGDSADEDSADEEK